MFCLELVFCLELEGCFPFPRAGLVIGVCLLIVRCVVQVAPSHGIAEREIFREAQNVLVPELVYLGVS